jgi:hypothetical protein
MAKSAKKSVQATQAPQAESSSWGGPLPGQPRVSVTIPTTEKVRVEQVENGTKAFRYVVRDVALPVVGQTLYRLDLSTWSQQPNPDYPESRPYIVAAVNPESRIAEVVDPSWVPPVSAQQPPGGSTSLSNEAQEPQENQVSEPDTDLNADAASGS